MKLQAEIEVSNGEIPTNESVTLYTKPCGQETCDSICAGFDSVPLCARENQTINGTIYPQRVQPIVGQSKYKGISYNKMCEHDLLTPPSQTIFVTPVKYFFFVGSLFFQI